MQAPKAAAICGISLIASAALLGYFLEQSVERYRSYERTVQVKGLSEKEVSADTAIWPIQ
ncbi:hypothetical protein [Aliiglaciecola sp. LCG003]|uniref:hypothetical protein n=1 Tax=Aliiglaciecola sp. LCG003 TaxID=3053655 RepID=UPI0033654232